MTNLETQDTTKPHVFKDSLDKVERDEINERVRRISELVEPNRSEDNMDGFTRNLYQYLPQERITTSTGRPMTTDEINNLATRVHGAVELAYLAVEAYTKTLATARGEVVEDPSAYETHEFLKEAALKHGFGETTKDGEFRIIEVETPTRGFRWALDTYAALGSKYGREAPIDLQDKKYRDSLEKDMRYIFNAVNRFY